LKNEWGVVSNCFARQLKDGIRLDDILLRAVGEGFDAVELRQTSLGDCESDSFLPDAVAIKHLVATVPHFAFNYAMNYPFLSPDHHHHGDVFLEAGIAAATACGADGQGGHAGHLRLVDLSTTDRTIEDLAHKTVANISELVRIVADSGLRLSLEHARQRWRNFRSVCEELNTRGLGDRYEICLDPANFCISDSARTAPEAFDSLRQDRISMVHLKQYTHGGFADELCEGEIDWSACKKMFKAAEYKGPFLFEIGASEDIWRKLRLSREYWCEI
jgi:sugar phosphate isomerase/epimerase